IESHSLSSIYRADRKLFEAGDRVKTWMKVMMVSIMSLVVLGLVSGVLFIILTKETQADEEQTLKEMNQYSYDTPEITTDLKDGRFVRIEFLIVADGKKGLKEIEDREFQVKNVLIKEISLMSESDFSDGLSELEETIMDRLND